MPKSDRADIPEAARALLDENSLGIMTTIRHNDGRMSSNPVGYVWTGEALGVSTLKSRMKYKYNSIFLEYIFYIFSRVIRYFGIFHN